MHDPLARLEPARIALRVSFGLVPLLAGLDKFFYLLTDWSAYVSPLARTLLPVDPHTFLYAVGIIEVGVGLAVLTRWTVIGSYAAAAWLSLVAVNLVLAGFLDIAVRDAVLAVAAFSLARMTESRGTVAARVEEPSIELSRRVA